MKFVPKRNKKGAFSDLFLLMIFALVIVFISVLWIYMGGQVSDQLHESMGGMDQLHDTNGNNATQVIDNTIGDFNNSIQALTWISIFLIVGMILSIFIGSYLVTTKPVFFIPYLFIVIIAVIVSIPLSNSYEKVMSTETLASTFQLFGGANWFFYNLPVWITIIGLTGAIIMFSQMGKKEDPYGQF